MDEKRRYQRISVSFPGVIQLTKGAEVSTEIIEISEGGLKCSFPQPVTLGVGAELRFTLPVAAGKQCVLVGRVQHYHRNYEAYLLGVEFTRVADEVLDAIRQFVRQQAVTS